MAGGAVEWLLCGRSPSKSQGFGRMVSGLEGLQVVGRIQSVLS